MKRRHGMIVALTLVSLLMGCTQHPYTFTGAAVGGGLGAVAGAALSPRNPWQGAIIGGAVGGVLGGVAGEAARQSQPQRQGYYQQPYRQPYQGQPYQGRAPQPAYPPATTPDGNQATTPDSNAEDYNLYSGTPPPEPQRQARPPGYGQSARPMAHQPGCPYYR